MHRNLSSRPALSTGRRPAVVVTALVIAGALAVSVTAGASVGPPAQGSSRRPVSVSERSIRLRPGLWLTRIRYARQPNEVRILTITPSLGPKLDVQPGRATYPIWVRPSTVAARLGDVAIVNAAFTSKGVPVHASLVDGELWTSGTQTADALALTPGGDRAFIGQPSLSIVARPQGGAAFRVTNWNARPPKGEGISAYTSRGGNATPPPGVATPVDSDPVWCAARLVPTTTIGWTGARRAGITRSYIVQDRPDPCPRTPEVIGPTDGSVVLAGRAGRVGGNAVRALTPGATIRLTWSFAGWPGVTDVIGGQPILVSRGVNVAPAPTPGDSYFYYQNPRTAAGVNAGCLDARPVTVCRVMLMTVDGRQAARGWSAGWTLRQLARQLVRRGAVRAINFDGGGSTEMWVRPIGHYCRSRPATGGCLVNKPSGAGGERASTVSIGVLPGADLGEVLLPRREPRS
jgi:hypothetical protein